jgi:hypothetical protein
MSVKRALTSRPVQYTRPAAGYVSARYGKAEDGYRIIPNVSQAVLAEMVGTMR